MLGDGGKLLKNGGHILGGIQTSIPRPPSIFDHVTQQVYPQHLKTSLLRNKRSKGQSNYLTIVYNLKYQTSFGDNMMVTVIRDRSDEDEAEEKDKDQEAYHDYVFMIGGKKRSARNNQSEKENTSIGWQNTRQSLWTKGQKKKVQVQRYPIISNQQ